MNTTIRAQSHSVGACRDLALGHLERAAVCLYEIGRVAGDDDLKRRAQCLTHDVRGLRRQVQRLDSDLGGRC